MSAADEVLSAAQRLDAAAQVLRERDDDALFAPLIQFFDRWSEPRGAWQAELADELAVESGFGIENLRSGLEIALKGWNGAAFRAAFEVELGGAAAPARVGAAMTAICLGGSIPMPSLLQLALPLALRSPVLAKPASRDRVTARVFARRLAEVDPELGRCIEVVDFRRDDDAATAGFCASECVVGIGADETVAALRAQCGPRSHFVAYGHKLSVAVLDLDDAALQVAEVARDMSLWDQLGCLSPVAIYLLRARAGSDEVHAFGEALARELHELEASSPRGHVDAASAVLFRNEVDEARMRLGNDAVLCPADLAWAVVLEEDARRRPHPLHRFVRVHPVGNEASLLAALRPVAGFLSSVGLASADARLALRLAELGASRVCAPGQMQAPPISWPHDGAPPFSALIPSR